MNEQQIVLSFIHGENLMFFIVAMYALAIIGWTAICYLIIKLWQGRKKKKRAQREEDASAETNELNSPR